MSKHDPPTFLVDEADAIFNRRSGDQSEQLRGMLNAGYQRNRPYLRWDPKTRQRIECPTFAMAALAGIGRLPDTVEDRSVVISLRRRRRDEKIEQFRVRDIPSLVPIRDALAKWIDANRDALKQARPAMAPLEDRAADVWEPLYAIAEAAGGEWPERARDAAQALTYESEQGDTELLLSHVYDAFESDGGEKMKSEDLVEALLDRDDGPWAARWGRDITRSQIDGRSLHDYRVVYSKLAAQLKAFDIASQYIKVGGRTYRGYVRRDFNDVWNRLQIWPVSRHGRYCRNWCNSAGQTLTRRNQGCNAAQPERSQVAAGCTDSRTEKR